MVNAHGKHVFADYTGYQYDDKSDGEKILEIILEGVEEAEVRQVHSHVEEFDGDLSPPGFAVVVLIDESHVTAHCYYDNGWLAVDAFTCGGGNPGLIIDHIQARLEEKMPSLRLMRRETVSRFLHDRSDSK